jgi:hypothetical protein
MGVGGTLSMTPRMSVEFEDSALDTLKELFSKGFRSLPLRGFRVHHSTYFIGSCVEVAGPVT